MIQKFYKSIKFFAAFLFLIGISNDVLGQCNFISSTFSQNFETFGRQCAPIKARWTVTYNFSSSIGAANASKVYVFIRWNDPADTRRVLSTIPNGAFTAFTAIDSLTFPAGGSCSYTPDVRLVWDDANDGVTGGDICTGSLRDFTFESWSTDDLNGGNLAITPLEQEVCFEDSTVNFQFQDATFPNCDVSVEIDRPNQSTRWVQFIYGTGAGPRIPNVSIDTGGGTVQITDGAGNIVNTFAGPIIEIPANVLQANLNELTYPINHPVGANIGDELEITLRNWNVCNPYDATPINGSPPPDIINGDSTPITTTARLVIIGPTTANAGPPQGICGTSTNLAGNVITVGTGVWNQISGPAVLNITNANNPTTNVNITGSNYGTYQLEWSSTLGACSAGRDTVEITFFEPPSNSNAGAPQNICGNSTTLNANNPAVGSGQWNYISGPAGFTISNSLLRNSAFSSTSYGTYVLEWRIDNGTCPDEVDNVTIVFEEPANAADAGLPVDTTACNTLSYNLMGNVATTAGTNGTWTLVAQPPGGAIVSILPNANDPNAVVTFNNYTTGAQRYRMRWRITSGTGICPNQDDFIDIRAFQTPSTATTGGAINLCGLTTTLNGNTPAVGQGTWSQVSGPGTSIFVNENNPTTNVTVSIDGTYVFRWTIRNGNCPPTTADVSVQFDPPPTTPLAGPDDSICNTLTYVLDGNQITNGTGTWIQNSGPAIVGFTPNANDENATVTFSTQGVHEFIWESDLPPACPILRDTVIIRVFSFPSPAAIVTADPTSTCNLTGIPISAVAPAIGFGQWYQLTGPGALTIGDSVNNNTTVSAPVSGTYEVLWEVTNGNCSPPQRDTLTLILESPSPAIAGNDTSVCAAFDTLNANTPSVGTGMWSVIAQPGGGTFSFDDDTKPNARFDLTNGVFGAYTLRWTISNGGCANEISDVTVTFFDNPTPANVIADFQICADTAQLVATPVTVGSGQWQLITGTGPAAYNPNFNDPNAIVTVPPISNTEVYEFEWTTSNGVCLDAKDTLEITFFEISTTPAAGGDFEVCNTSTNLAGNAISVGMGQWNPLPLLSTGPITITTPSSPTTSVNIPSFVNDSDTFFLEWTSQNGNCVTLRDTVRVIFHDDPTVSAAGSDIDICADTAQLNANVPATGSGQWIIASGSATVDNNNDPATIVRANPFGGDSSIVVLTWRITNGNCSPSNNNVRVVFYNDPTVANAGGADSICSLVYPLIGNFAAIGEGTWSQITGPGTSGFGNINDETTNVTVSAHGTYSFEWQIANGPCLITRDTVSIRFDEFPSSSNAGSDDTVCALNTVLDGNNPAVGNGVWTQVSGPSVAVFNDSSVFNTAVAVGSNGTYVFEWTISNGVCADSSDQVAIIFESAASNNGIIGDTTVCLNTSNLVYTVQFTPGSTYSWVIPATATLQFGGGINDNFVVLTFPNVGTQELKVLATNSFGCASDTQRTSVEVYGFPIAAAGNNVAICSGDTAVLGGAPTATGGSGFYNYQWSPTGGLDNANSANPNASPIFSRTYFLTVTDSIASCISNQDTVTVTVNPSPSTQLLGLTPFICEEDTALLRILFSTGTGPFAVEISNGVDTTLYPSLSNGDTIEVVPDSTLTYNVISVLDSATLCVGTVFSGAPIVNVRPLPTASLSTLDSVICEGEAANLTLSVSGPTPQIYTVQYAINGSDTTTINLSGSTTNFQVFPDSSSEYTLISVTDNFRGCRVDAPSARFTDSVFVQVDSLPRAVLSGADTICVGDSAALVVNFTVGDGPFDMTIQGLGAVNNYNSGDTIWVFPTATTIYTLLQAADTNNCATSSSSLLTGSAIIQVNPLPVANLIGTSTICFGDTANLQVNIAPGTGPFSVVINDGTTNDTTLNYNNGQQIPVGPLVTTTYNLVSVLDANGCYSSAPSSNLTGTPQISINPLPTASIDQDDTICFDDDVILNFSFTGQRPFTFTFRDNTRGVDSTLTTTGTNTTRSVTVSPDSTTLYSLVSVIDANGCIDSIGNPISTTFGDTVEIVVDSLPVATIVADLPTDTICNGDQAYLYVNITTGPSPYTLSISNGVGTINNYVSGDSIPVNPTTIGLNEYIITNLLDQNGCSVTAGHPNIDDTARVVVNPLPSATLSGTAIICLGDTTPLSVAITPGASPFTVVINDGTQNDTIANYLSGTNIDVNPVVTTSYTLVSVLDSFGCYTSAPSADLSGTPQVTVRPLPTAQINSDDTICFGDNVTLSFSFTGQAPFTYIYKDNTTGINDTLVTVGLATSGTTIVSPDTTTLYTLVSVQGANGCIDSVNNPVNPTFGDTVEIVVDSLPVATIVADLPTDTICNGDQAYLYVNITTGPGPYTLSISNGVGTINNYVSGDSIPVNPTTIGANDYIITSLLDQNGCSVTTGHPNIDDTATIYVNPLPNVTLGIDTNRICFGDTTNLRVQLNVGTGPLEFLINNITDTIRGFNPLTDSIPVSPNVTTTYSIAYVTDANGCTVVAPSANINGAPQLNVNPLPTAQIASDDTICFGDNSILNFSFTGSTPFTFTFRDNTRGVDSTLSTAGTLTSRNVTVSPDSTTLYSLVSVTDGQGCTDSVNNAPISATFGDTVEIVVDSLPVATIVADLPTDTICNGDQAYLYVNITTGPGPYTLSISNGVGTINNYVSGDSIPVNPTTIGANDYIITSLLDQNGCSVTTGHPNIDDTATIYVNPLPNVTLGIDTNRICFGDTTNLRVQLNVGTGPLEFLINNITDTIRGFNPLTDSIPVSPNVTTTYSIAYVTDANGCTVVAPSANINGAPQLNVNPLPTAQIASDDTICFGDNSILNFSFTGSTPFTFTFRDNTRGVDSTLSTAGTLTSRNVTVSPDSTTLYSLVSVTDGQGCTDSVNNAPISATFGDTVEIVVDSLPVATIVADLPTDTICNGDQAYLYVNITTGPGPYTLSISNGIGTINNYVSGDSIPVNPTTIGANDYIITSLLDQNGCSVTTGHPNIDDTATIYVNPLPNVTLGIDTNRICFGDTTNLRVQLNVGTGPLEFLINNITDTIRGFNPLTDSIPVSPNATTTYSIAYVTDANGCTVVAPSANINGAPQLNVNPLPTAQIADSATICLEDQVVLAFSFTGSTPFTFTYRDNLTGNDSTLSTAGGLISRNVTVRPLDTTLYTLVSIQDGQGCIDSINNGPINPNFGDTVLISVNPLPITTLSVIEPTDTICAGETAYLQVDVTNIPDAPAPYSVELSNGVGVITGYNLGDSIPVNPSVIGNNQYFIVELIDANGCNILAGHPNLPDTVNVNVRPRPVIELKIEQNEICFGDSTRLFWNIPVGSPRYDFVLNTDPTDTIRNVNANDSIWVSPLDTTQYSIIYFSDSFGCSVVAPSANISGTPILNVNPLPTAALSINNDTLCFGEQTTITFNLTGPNAPYTYQIDSGAANYSGFNAINGTALNYVLNPGLHEFNLEEVIDNKGCIATIGAADSLVSVFIHELPTAVISGDTSVCENEPFTLNFALTGNDPLEVYFNDGTNSYQRTLNTPTDTAVILLPASVSPYFFRLDSVVDNNAPENCNATSLTGLVNVRVNSIPRVAINSFDSTICDGNQAILSFTILNGRAPFEIDLSTDGGITVDTTLTNVADGSIYLVRPNDTTTYTIMEIRETATPEACVGLIDPNKGAFTINVNPLPTANISLNGPNTVCFGDSISISLTFTGKGPFDVQLLTNYAGPITLNNVQGDTTFNVSSSFAATGNTINLFRLNDSHIPECGVLQGAPQLTGSVTFNINDLPTAQLIPFGLTTICEGDSTQLLVLVNQGDAPYTIYISDTTSTYVDSLQITSGSTGTIYVNPTVNSTFVIDSVVDSSSPESCNATNISGQVTVRVNTRPTATISGLDEICFLENSSFQISTTGTGPWLVNYTNGIDTLPTVISQSANPKTINVSIPPVGINKYWITSISDNGLSPSCAASVLPVNDTATIIVNDQPTADLSGDTTICDGSPLPIYLDFGVTAGPFNAVVTDGTNTYSFTGLSASDTVLVNYPGPGFYIYRYSFVEDDITKCVPQLTSGQAIVQVRPIPTVTLSVVGSNIICGKDSVSKFLQFNFSEPNVFDLILQRNGVAIDTLTSIGNGTILPVPGLQVGNNVYTIQPNSAVYTFNPRCELNIVDNANILVNADPTVTVQDNDTICVGNSATLTFGLSGATPWTVQYIGGSGIQTLNTVNASQAQVVTPVVTTSYRVINVTDGNSCSTNNISPSDSTEATITVNQLPTAQLRVDGFFSQSVTFCEEDTIALQLQLTGNGPFDVQIQDNQGNPAIIRNGAVNLDTILLINPVPAVGQTTSYFLSQVLDNNNPQCAPTSLGSPVDVTVQPLPTANISGDTTICLGNPAPLTFTFTGTGPWTYRYFDGTFVSATQQTNVSTISLNVNPTVTTNYKIFDVVDQGTVNQCGVDSTDQVRVTGSATVTVTPAVAADFTFTTDDACGDPTFNFVDATTPADTYGYNWTFGDGASSVLQNPTHQYANTGLNVTSFTVKLLVTSPLGCQDSITETVDVKPDIVADVTVDTTIGCSELTVNFISNTVSAGGVKWDFTNNGTQLINGAAATSFTFENTGLTDLVYNVYNVVQNQFGCTDTAIIPITVKPLPKPAFTANPQTQNWPIDPVTLTNQTPNLNGNTYIWDFGDGTGSTNTNDTHLYTTWGDYDVTLTARTSFGCVDSVTEIVVIIPELPSAGFFGTKAGCIPFTYTPTDSSSFVAESGFLWKLINPSTGEVLQTYFGSAPVINVTFEGTFDLRQVVTGLGSFRDSMTINDAIIGYRAPSAAFFTDDTVFVDKGITFIDRSILQQNLETTFFWDFGDGTTSRNRSPNKSYRIEDTYNVTFVVSQKITDDVSCSDTVVNPVVVLPVGDIIVPTAFIPNEGGPTGGAYDPDNRLDVSVFYPVVRKAFVKLEFEVYNRWGEPIFQSNVKNVGWDGYINGSIAPEGVYIYRVRVEFEDGTIDTELGDVTLLRK